MALSSLPKYFHLTKVASILKISKPLVLKMARAGEIPSTRTPQGLRVEEAQLSRWIDGQRVDSSSLAKTSGFR